MHPQTHTSPDALLTLTSGPTRTVDAAHPLGFDDWIIEIEAGGEGGFHTHPSLLAPKGSSDSVLAEATQAFIDAILEDRTILIVRTDQGRIIGVDRLDPAFHTLDSAVLEAQTDPHRSPAETVTFRLWSGRVRAQVDTRHPPLSPSPPA